MMAEFRMPSLGADMESATLTEWLVKPGDAVERGTVVAAVETAKGIIDIEIFEDGVIETLVASIGDQVPVGGVLAVYRGAKQADAERVAPAEPAAAVPRAAARPPVGAAPPAAPSAAWVRRRAPDGHPPSRRLVSPAARRRAAELDVDIEMVAPSGAGGAVTLQDIERAAARPVAPADMRTLIAQAMSRAKREIPHYYLGTTIEMDRAQRFVTDWNAAHPVIERLLPGVLLLKAVALALRKTPELNGYWREGRFEAGNAINVGTATRLRQGGLVAPALLAADTLPLPELMRQFQDLVQRARAGRLKRAELTEATITVSSLGEGGVETLYPIIYPPQVAIVGFGSIVVRPWTRAGALVSAPILTATLSADHRVSDGHRGSQFLVEVDRLLQRPEEL